MLRLCLAVLLVLGNVAPATSQLISNFTLVANGTKRVLEDGGNIILSLDLPPLSIRVETTEEVSYLIFDLDDGVTVRTERQKPFYLGGDHHGVPWHVNSLEDLGIHTLRLTAYIDDDVVADDVAISFEVVQDEPSISGPRFIASGSQPKASILPIPFVDIPAYEASSSGALSLGTPLLWHKLTLGFTSFPTSETNIVENPFQHYRMDVNFTHPETGASVIVPGYYATDGNAANSGRRAGPVWLCHFIPNKLGVWDWSVSFTEGFDVAALGSTESASYFDGDTGSFQVLPSDKTGKDFRGKGMLETVPDVAYLRHSGNGEFFFQIGACMEDMLANPEFDNTPNSTSANDYADHKRDYNFFVDSTWKGGLGQGLAGAINYLSDNGITSIAVDTLSPEAIFPFISPQAPLQFDTSKLSQWEIPLDHAGTVGVHVQMNLDNGNGGELSIAQMIYYREMVARYSHLLGLSWRVGPFDGENQTSHVDYITTLDPYNHPIILSPDASPANSTSVGGPVSVSDGVWQPLMAGEALVAQTDGCAVDCGDFRANNLVPAEIKYALEFFSMLPFETLSSSSSNSSMLTNALSTLIVIYVGTIGETVAIDLPNPGIMYTIHWYNASGGGSLQQSGSVESVTGGFSSVDIGAPASAGNSSWVAVLSTPEHASLFTLAPTAAPL